MRNFASVSSLAREEAELQKRLLYSLFMQAPTLIAGAARARITSSSWPIRRCAKSGDTRRTSC